MSTIKSEVIKLVTTRTAFALTAGAAAVAAIAAASTTAGASVEALEVPLRALPMYPLAVVNLAAFALIAGMKVFTDEYRHGSIVPTLLATPQRRSVVASKLAVAAAYGATLTALATAVMLGVALGVFQARGASPAWEAGDLWAVAGMVVAGAIWAAIGVSVGSLIRHQVAAIVGGIVWVLVIENLASVAIGDASRLLPGHAAWALARAEIASPSLGPTAGAILMLAYAVVITAIALKALQRRDVAAA